jgi:hypothetical protein
LNVPGSTTNLEVALATEYFHPFFWAKSTAESTSLNVSWKKQEVKKLLQFWMKISRDSEYDMHGNTVRLLKGSAPEVQPVRGFDQVAWDSHLISHWCICESPDCKVLSGFGPMRTYKVQKFRRWWHRTLRMGLDAKSATFKLSVIDWWLPSNGLGNELVRRVMLTDLLACSVGIPLKTASSATFFNFSPKTGTPITSVMVVGKTERDKKSLFPSGIDTNNGCTRWYQQYSSDASQLTRLLLKLLKSFYFLQLIFGLFLFDGKTGWKHAHGGTGDHNPIWGNIYFSDGSRHFRRPAHYGYRIRRWKSLWQESLMLWT